MRSFFHYFSLKLGDHIWPYLDEWSAKSKVSGKAIQK